MLWTNYLTERGGRLRDRDDRGVGHAALAADRAGMHDRGDTFEVVKTLGFLDDRIVHEDQAICYLNDPTPIFVTFSPLTFDLPFGVLLV